MIICYNDITESVNILLQSPLTFEKTKHFFFNVGITLSHNLLGMATMERIKFALSLNGYQSYY